MTESRQGTSVKPDPDVANPVSGQADDLVARRTGMVSLSPRHISAPQLARRMCVERTQGRYIASAEQLLTITAGEPWNWPVLACRLAVPAQLISPPQQPN